MRRVYTNEVVLLIAGLLLAAAWIFAWQRSGPTARMRPPGVTQPAMPREGEPFDWQTRGVQTYQASCASCHSQGQATSRVPPLRSHVVDLFEADQGRAYLAAFLLYGRAGPIEVGGQTYPPRHPTYQDRLSDEQIAAVLNHVLTAWGNDAQLSEPERLYVPQDIAEHRRGTLMPEQVRALRPEARGE